MKFPRERLVALVCACAVAGLAGCGGSSSSKTGGGGGGGDQSNPTTVTYTFSSGTPSVLAVQTGTGPYAAVTLSQNVATFSVPAGTTDFSVAYLCPPFPSTSPDSQMEIVDFRSTLDGSAFQGSCGFSTQGVHTDFATGAVDASAFPLASTMSTTLLGANSTGAAVNFQYSNLPISGVFQTVGPVGNDTAILLLNDSSQNVIAAKSFTNQVVPGAINGGNTISFTSADAAAPQTLTYANVPAGATNTSTSAGIRSSSDSSLFIPLANGMLTHYPSLPSGIVDNAMYYSFASGTQVQSAGLTLSAESDTFPSTAGPLTVSFSDMWQGTAPTPSALPSFTFDYQGWSAQEKSSIYRTASLNWLLPGGNFFENLIFIDSAANYQGGAQSLSVPDLSGVPGFLAPPASGTTIYWNKSESVGSFPSSTTDANGTNYTVLVSGSYPEP